MTLTPSDVESLERAWTLALSKPDESESIISHLDATEAHAAAAIAIVRGRSGFRQEPASHLQSVASAAATLEHDPVWHPRALITLGRLRLATGDDRGAIGAFESWLAMDVATDAPTRFRLLLDLAYCSYRVGESTAAAEYCIQARNIAEQSGDESGVAQALLMMGSIFRELDDQQEALRCYEGVLAIAQHRADNSLVAKAHFSIGQVQHDVGNADVAIEQFRRALPRFEQIGDRRSSALAVMEIATLLREGGDSPGAVEHLDRARALAEEIGDRHLVAGIDANLGAAFVELERFDDALAALERARETMESIDSRLHLREVYKPLAELHERRGDLELAMRYLTAHVRLSEELGKAEARKRVHAIAAARQIAIAEKNVELERLRTVELASALDELKHAQSQLVHSEKMASLGVLTAGIAHEINNPVNFIRTSLLPLRRDIAQIVDGELDDNERLEIVDEIHALLHGIAEGAERTAEIVRSLRTFSRLDEDELKPVDLHEGIDATLTLLHPRIADIAVVRQYGELPDVTCRAGQINQVFMSVLANAIDATSDRGTITISTRRDVEHAVLAISDTGVGIDAEHMPRIFEPFYTTKPVGAGQGLGLSISYAIIERHGGSMSVDSTPGIGTTVTMRLPIGGTAEPTI